MLRSMFIVILSAAVLIAGGPSLCFAEQEIDLGEIVVTPAGFREPALDHPGSVTVITEKDIEESNAKYVYELLRREPGLYVTDYTHAGKTVTVDMRGFGEMAARNVLVMVDGRRLNEIDISGPDWSQIPLEDVERVEILRGSGSVLYGDNATAGVINVITRRGKKGHHFRCGAEFGSYRHRSYYGSVYGGEDFASYNFFYKHERSDGYRLNGGDDSYDFLGDMEIRPAGYLDIGVSAGYHKDWYGMPAGLQRVEIDRYGYRGSTTPTDRSKVETTFFKVSPRVRVGSAAMDHEFTMDLWGRKKRLDTTTWDNVFGGGATWDNSQIDSVSASARYVNTGYLRDIVNHLSAGIDLFSAGNRLLTVTPAWGTYNQLTVKKRTLGICANDKIEIFDRFIVSGGVRQTWAEYDFDQTSNARRYIKKSPDQEAYDAGVEYRYYGNGAVYGRFSRSFRFPATDEFYSRWSGLNDELRHQKADTWEVGVKDYNWKYFQPSVNLFWMGTSDEIFYDPTQGAFGDNRNYDKVRRFGVESGMVSELLANLSAYATYTYIDAEFEGGLFEGNRVPMVPEHKLAWGVHFVPVQLIELDLNSEYLSGQFAINDEYNRLPELKPHFVCNGKITLKFEGAEVFFGVNNIFDSMYAEIAAANVAGTVVDLHPAPGRNYMCGFSCKF